MDVESGSEDLDQVIERYHLALDAFARGDHEPAKRLFSEREDVTLGNPFGPFVKGSGDVVAAMEAAAANYRDGDARGFDTIATHVVGDLACTVEVERWRSKVGGRHDVALVELRVTTVFRREDGGWRIVHRHADPITTSQPAESVLHER